MIINDISVSRYHSVIKVINGEYYLEDLNSKFGTLIQLQNEIILLHNKQLGIQMGKYYMTFLVKKTFWAYLTCFSYKQDLKDYDHALDLHPPIQREKIYDCICKEDSFNSQDENERLTEQKEDHTHHDKIIEESMDYVDSDSAKFSMNFKHIIYEEYKKVEESEFKKEEQLIVNL